jgi:hypothetical protein
MAPFSFLVGSGAAPVAYGPTVRVALPASGSWSCEVSVFVDYSQEQVEKELAFGRFQEREDLLLRGESLGMQLAKQVLASAGEADEPRSAVGLTDPLFEQPFRFEAAYQQTRRVAVDPDAFGQTALINIRLAVC